jgi:hypothetical protein
VAWNGRDADYEEFVERHRLTFPQLADTAGVLFDEFGVPFQPALAIVPMNGDIELLIGSAGSPMLDMIISQTLSS